MNTQYKGSMPKELKKKWLKELRSGEWIQTADRLHDPKTGGFCCLGVLQYIASGGKCEADNLPLFKGLPSSQWLEDNRCSFGRSGDVASVLSHLALMNDDFQLDRNDETGFIPDSGNFAEIADWIDVHIEGI